MSQRTMVDTNFSRSGLGRACIACLGGTLLATALLGGVGLRADADVVESGSSSLFSDGFESGLGTWLEVTRSAGNRTAITTSPVHGGSQAAALILSSLSSTGYVALSYPLSMMTEVRLRSWVYDFGNLSPNPLYADAVLQELSGGALAYRAAGRPVPAEFAHNVANLWNRHKRNIDWGRTYYYRLNSDPESQGWHWMGGTVAAFLSLEPATYEGDLPLVSAAEELAFLQRRWLINDGRVAVPTAPVAAITETAFLPGTPSYAWFLNANQTQDSYIWGYLYHYPELLEWTTLVTPTVYLPSILVAH